MRKRILSLILAAMLFISAALPAAANEDVAQDAPETEAAAESEPAAEAETEAETVVSDTEPEPAAPAQTCDMTATELVSRINLGWNLGESLEAWASDAGYDDYYNGNAYQMQLRYDDADGNRSASVAKQFDSKNQCTISWATGLIDSDSEIGLGDIGFEVWNLTVEEATTVTVNVTTAKLTRRNKQVIVFDELLGEHTLTISKYGTVALLTTQWPDNLSRTYGITDGTYEVTMELVDFPQKEYDKSEYFETLWNNPLTTQEMISEVKREGFNAVRVPVTFFNHVPSNSDTVDADWLDRMQEVVDYVVNEDMYCILCFYHDGGTTGWVRVASDTDVDRYLNIWKQVAERFINYDEHLLFQGYNELTNKDSKWDYPGKVYIDWVNSLAQQFVDTVRSTGGCNADRCLVVSPYAGSHEQQIIDEFKLPTDTAYDRLIVSLNAYFPAEFAYDIELASDEVSSTDYADWGSEADRAALDELFLRLYKRFVSQNVPFIIGEFNTADKGNTEPRAVHAAYYTSKAAEYGIPCFWWDDGSLMQRSTLTWYFPEIADAMVNATSMHVDKLSIGVPDNIYYTGEPLYPDVRIYYYGGDVLSGTDLVSGSDVVLTEGVDYELMLFDNTELGTATVTLTGIGNYSGVREFEFEITKKPIEVGVLTNLAKADPDLPLVIMLSFPAMLLLAGIAVYQTMKRRERERAYFNIASSLRGAKIADTSDIDDNADFSYLRVKPEREPRQSRRQSAAEAQPFTDEDF